jgi:hypothetical protein
MSDFDETKNGRVTHPADLNDEQALKDYGRQLAMDSLIADLQPAEVVEFPKKNWSRRSWLSASAASVAGIAGFAIWKFNRDPSALGNPVAGLDPRWILEAAAGAEYEISGELRLTSREPAKLLVSLRPRHCDGHSIFNRVA